MRITKPRRKKRQRTHGFLKRSSNQSGKKILKQRRKKGRNKLTV